MSALVITCPDCGTRYKATAASIGDDGRTVRCVKCESTWFVPAPDVIDTIISDPDALALADNIAAQNQPAFTAEPESSLDPDPVAIITGSVAAAPPPVSSVSEAPSDPVSPVAQESQPEPAPTVGADVMMRDHVDRKKLYRRRRTIRFIWAVPILLVIVAAIIAYFNRQEIVNRIPQMASVYQMIGVEVRAGGLEIDPPQARTILIDGQPVIRVESVVRNLTNKPKTVPLIELTLHDSDGQGLIQWYVEPDPAQIGARGRLVFTSEIANPPAGAIGLRYRFSDDIQLSAASGL
ncbi:thioredoxin [Algimonas arctica]|uniref:Thioredoxin n=1 Tax=Algimonas arctica TaxID=1479486 RepID=A0A8J3CQV2_9PROT|nr:DUF3426 domain-containing protein [Algimonas arctica]GHA98430.1 thioredoxin [Algimonas arctica]